MAASKEARAAQHVETIAALLFVEACRNGIEHSALNAQGWTGMGESHRGDYRRVATVLIRRIRRWKD